MGLAQAQVRTAHLHMAVAVAERQWGRLEYAVGGTEPFPELVNTQSKRCEKRALERVA